VSKTGDERESELWKHRREGTGCLHDITSARRKEGMLDPEKE
jgi:hypothetical protein